MQVKLSDQLALQQAVVIPVSPVIYSRIGLPENVFVAQLHFWLSDGQFGVEFEGSRWIYNTIEQWAEQLAMTTSQVERIVRSLRKKGIVKTQKLHKGWRNHTLFYTIDYHAFSNVIHGNKTQKSISEKTETLTKSTYRENPQNTKTNKAELSFSEIVLEQPMQQAVEQPVIGQKPQDTGLRGALAARISALQQKPQDPATLARLKAREDADRKVAAAQTAFRESRSAVTVTAAHHPYMQLPLNELLEKLYAESVTNETPQKDRPALNKILGYLKSGGEKARVAVIDAFSYAKERGAKSAAYVMAVLGEKDPAFKGAKNE